MRLPSFTFSSITIVWKLIPYFDNSCLVSQNVCLKVSKHLLTWAEEQTYWIAARFLMLGFKLELYSPNEYCMVYWYLYIILMRLLDKMQVRLSNRGDCKNLNFILVFLGQLSQWTCIYLFESPVLKRLSKGLHTLQIMTNARCFETWHLVYYFHFFFV